MYFVSGKEMLGYILMDVDFYNPGMGLYVFHYNDEDAICVYTLSEQTVCELSQISTGDHWEVFLGYGGQIYERPHQADNRYCINICWCEEHYLGNWLRVMGGCLAGVQKRGYSK